MSLSLRADGVNSLRWLHRYSNLTLSIWTSQVKADSVFSRCRCWGWGSSGLPARRALSGCQQGLHYRHLEAASRWWWKLDFGIFCGPVSRSSKNSQSCLEDDGTKSEPELFFSLTYADVRLEPTTGSSAMTHRWSLLVSPLPAWWRVVPTSSVCVQ